MEIQFSLVLVLFAVFLSELTTSLAEEIMKQYEILGMKQKGDLKLTCSSNLSPPVYPDQVTKWFKGDKEIDGKTDPMYTISTIKVQAANQNTDVSELHINRALQLGETDNQAGNYTCVISSKGKEVYNKIFEVFTEPFVKLPSYVNVVEEEKLRITCTVYGKPAPKVEWTFIPANTSYSQSAERIKLQADEERKVPNAVLIVDTAGRLDKGDYKCLAINHKNASYNSSKITTVYVKGKLDALWPFLGIVAEVVVLCAIILVYEKKRNNNAELEESDTDQSPDQKNTPDHGKDTVRHRK